VALIDGNNRVSLRTSGECFGADTGRRHRACLLSHLATVQPQPALAAEPA
jgi:uncharacterized protein (DUF58 family)